MFSSEKKQNSIVVLVIVLLVATMMLTVVMGMMGETAVHAAPSGGTTVSGPIITHTTWSLAGSPYIMDADVIVNEGITLTIEPGVIVTAANHSGITILGNLSAVGTVSKPITFTSVTNVESSGWGGITFEGSHGHIKYAAIQNGCSQLWIKDPQPDARFILENTTLGQTNCRFPIRVEMETLDVLEMTDVTFSDENYESIFIAIEPNSKIQKDATLLSYPGLDGYYIQSDSGMLNYFSIEPTATLTISSGLDVYLIAIMEVKGLLNIVGSVDEPTNVYYGAVDFIGGGGYIAHTKMIDSVLRIIELDPDIGLTIENCTLEDGISPPELQPIAVSISTLHRLHLSNVTFNNLVKRISLGNLPDQPKTLGGNVTLTSQPGLEGYELYENLPYSYTSDLIIPAGVTLTMEPGTTLFGNVNSGVIVSGHLEAQGTVLNPITFTTAVTTAWAGIDLTGGSANFDHVILSQAGANDQSALRVNGQLAVNHTTIHHNSGNGMDVLGGEVMAVCSTFSQNQSDGIYIADSSNPNVTIWSSDISGNGGAGLRNNNLNLAAATYNWWGDASGPGGIGPGSGDAVLGAVDYEPWLTAPVCMTRVYLPFITVP